MSVLVNVPVLLLFYLLIFLASLLIFDPTSRKGKDNLCKEIEHFLGLIFSLLILLLKLSLKYSLLFRRSVYFSFRGVM